MAIILNIETATSVCSVAIADKGKIIATQESEESNVHAEKLAVFIEEALKKAALTLKELDAIAIGSGPGSYTGLRIGTSTAKGLCYGLNKPLISVPTLKAMAVAASSPSSSPLEGRHGINLLTPNPSAGPSSSPLEGRHGKDILYCPMIDARRLEVYTALYDETGKEILPVQAKILDEHSFEEQLKTNTIAFFGDGMQKMRELFASAPAPLNLPLRGEVIWMENIKATAGNMVMLAEEAFNAKQFSDLAYYEPFYLKDFVALKKKTN